MKLITSIIALAIVTLTSPSATAQEAQPEKVYSFAKVHMPLEWYHEQYELWKEELKANPKNSDGWYSYWKAAQAVERMTADDDVREKMGKEVERIVEDCIKNVPGSFEALYMECVMNSSLSELDEFHTKMQKAYETDPSDPRSYNHFMIIGEMKRDLELRKKFANKMYQVNDLSSGVLNLFYNMMSGIEDNAILFTGGDNDTFASWMAQDVMGVKPNVMVLNSFLLSIKEYREAIFEELGITEPIPETEPDSSYGYQPAIIEHIIKHANRPVHFPVFTHLKEHFKDSLYLTGLTYVFNDEPVDDIALIKRNIERVYLMDYVKVSFQTHVMKSSIDRANMGYIPALQKLYSHYSVIGSQDQMSYVKELMLSISETAGQRKEVEEIIKNL